MAQGTFHATDEEPIDEVVRMDEEVVRADVVTFLARRTRTLGRCSFDARSKGHPWPLPPNRGTGDQKALRRISFVRSL